MYDSQICEACGMPITECDRCSGKICTPGCEDREAFGDGCTCREEEELEEEGDEEL